MKLSLIIRDQEFLNAFLEIAGRSSQDITIEILTGIEQGAEYRHSVKKDGFMYVTDYDRKEFISICGQEAGENGVFLGEEGDGQDNSREFGPFSMFKYERTDHLLADIRFIYGVLSGEEQGQDVEISRMSVFCDGDEIAGLDFCNGLARQIVYLCGCSVLVFPLTHIIREGMGDQGVSQNFKRMMYHISSGKAISASAFFIEDEYGVHHFRIPGGTNPFCDMSAREILGVTKCISDRKFDVVIFHIGSSCTKQAVNVIRSCGRRFWLHSSGESDPADGLPGRILGEKECSKGLVSLDYKDLQGYREIMSEESIREILSI